MKKLISTVTNLVRCRPTAVVLIGILLMGLFLRSYRIWERMIFDHDGDLYCWIVKDILVNHHIRLIGQQTSAEGIFIGPLFYYLMAFFFLFSKMDPWIGAVPMVILGGATTLSFYWVFAKLYNQTIGLIAAFIHAVSWSWVFFDQRIVPSTPTNLWMVWYFYIIVSLTRGNTAVLPILGILIGLIWHIHIALAPTFLAVPVALIMGKKWPALKQLCWMMIAILLLLSPLFLFEARHNFSQTIALIKNFSQDHGGGVGIGKFNLILLKIARNITGLFISPWDLSFLNHFQIISISVAVVGIILVKKIFPFKDFIPLLFWIIGSVGFFTFSSSLVSEYYFSHLEVIFIGIASSGFAHLFLKSKTGRWLTIGIFMLFAIKSFAHCLTESVYQKGYLVKKAVVDFIAADMKNQNFPCAAVSYITTPGENVGFRYFFWLKNLHINQPQSGSPVYSIVIPDELVNKVDVKFGHIGVITPKEMVPRQEILHACSGQNSNLTDPLLGYTE